MAYRCKDHCRLIPDVITNTAAGQNRTYANGYRRCSICQITIRTVSTRCPCCGAKLRVTPRKSNKDRRPQ